MATTNKSYTAPKGKPTAARHEDVGRSRRIPPTLEWILVGLVVVAIVVVAFIFTTSGDGSPHGGDPAEIGTTDIALTTIA